MNNQQSKNIFQASTSGVRFFKIITTPNIQDGKIRLPKGFTTKHSSDMVNPVFLKTPDGKKWEIHTTKIDEDFWFQKGWKEFANYYSLEHGNMIFFQFEKKSHFVVHIFGKSTLEIEYPFHDNQLIEQNNIVQISDDNSVEILNDSYSCKKKTRPKSSIPSPQPCKKLRSDTNEGVGTSTKFQNLPKSRFQTNENIDGNNKCPKEEEEHLTSKINEALSRARNFKSENLNFTVVIRSSYLCSHSLYVPAKFTNNYMKKGKKLHILLQLVDGRTWDATFYLGKIRDGWKKFANDNKLKNGDVCIFELIEYKTLTFKVLIYPLEKESHSTLPLELVQRERDRAREKNTNQWMTSKPTTEIVECWTDVPNAREVLIAFYGMILHEIQKIPKDHGYRSAVERITREKLMVCKEEEDLKKIENRLNCCQLEELIEEAKDELKLIGYMIG